MSDYHYLEKYRNKYFNIGGGPLNTIDANNDPVKMAKIYKKAYYNAIYGGGDIVDSKPTSKPTSKTTSKPTDNVQNNITPKIKKNYGLDQKALQEHWNALYKNKLLLGNTMDKTKTGNLKKLATFLNDMATSLEKDIAENEVCWKKLREFRDSNRKCLDTYAQKKVGEWPGIDKSVWDKIPK
jgi:hypothetical protein